MDGQLGLNGEHSLVPCMLDRFLELGSDYFDDESEANSRTPLKVWILSYSCCKRETVRQHLNSCIKYEWIFASSIQEVNL